MSPERLIARSPQNFVACGIGVVGPTQSGVIGQLGCIDYHSFRGPWSIGKRPQCGTVDLGDTSREIEIDKLDEVAELDSILYSNILVLVGEIFAGLCETDGREAISEEREMVTPTKEAIRAIDCLN